MRGVHSIMIRKICKKATVWLLTGVIGLSAVTVQAAEVDNGASLSDHNKCHRRLATGARILIRRQQC